MGIHDREYYREHTASRIAAARAPVTTALVLTCGVAYLVQVLTWRSGGGLAPWLVLDPERPLAVWRLLGSGFVHDPSSSLFGVAFRLFVLWWFGREVELVLGSRRTLLIYAVGDVTSALAYLGFCALTHETTMAAGASPGTFALAAACVVLYPRRQLMGFLDIRLGLLLLVAFDFSGAFGHAPYDGEPAYVGHVGALIAGAVMTLLPLRSQTAVVSAAAGAGETTRSGSTEQIPEHVEARVEALLEKISRTGPDSLTDDERRALDDASTTYRDRRSS